MMLSRTQFNPNFYARLGGMAYLVIILGGALGELLIRDQIIVSGDAVATARNIQAAPVLWRIGICGDIVMHVCDLILAMVYYLLFRPVNKNLATLSVLFGLVQTAVLVANKLNLMMPLFFLGDESYLAAFNEKQVQALAFIAVEAHEYGFGIGLIFFGFECLIDGYLVFRSGFLPKMLGSMLFIAGICYLINSFILILVPSLSRAVFQIILFPTFISELSMCLWLLIKGINVSKWQECRTDSTLQ